MTIMFFLPLLLLQLTTSLVGVHAATYIGFYKIKLEGSSSTSPPPTITLYLNPDQEQQQQNPPPEVDKLVLSFDPQAVRLRIKDSVLEMPVAEKEMPLMGWRTVVNKEKAAAGKGEGNYYSPTPTSVVEMSDGGGNGNLLQMQFSPTLYQNIYLVVMWSWRRKGREEEGKKWIPEAIATVLHAVYVPVEEGKKEEGDELVNWDAMSDATTSEAKEWRWEWGFLEVNSWPKPSFLLVPDDDKVAAAMQAKNELSISQRRMIKLSASDWPMGAEPSEVENEFREYFKTLVHAYERTGILIRSFHVGATSNPRISLYFKNNPPDDDKHGGGGGGSGAKRKHGTNSREQKSKAAAFKKLIVSYLPKETKLMLESSSLTKEELATNLDSSNSIPNDFMPNFNDNSNRKNQLAWLILPTNYRRIYILTLWTYPAELVSLGNKQTDMGLRSIATVLHAWYDAQSGMWDQEWGFLEAESPEATTPEGSSSKLVPYYNVPGKSPQDPHKKCLIDLSDRPLAMRIAYPEFQLKMQTALAKIEQRSSTSIAVIHTPVENPNSHQVTVVLHPKREEPFTVIRRFTFRYPLNKDFRVLTNVTSINSEVGPLLLAGYNEFEMATSEISNTRNTSSSSSSSTIYPRIFPEITKLAYIVVAWRGRGDDQWEDSQGVCLTKVTVARMAFDVAANDWVHPYSRSKDKSALTGVLCKYNDAATAADGKQPKQQRQPRFFFKPEYWNARITTVYPMLLDNFGSDTKVEKAEEALGKFFEKASEEQKQ